MSLPAAGTRQFYLGIAGQQTGPFSDADILTRIRGGQVPPDALVWYDGLPEWQPISTVEFFKDAFSQRAASDPNQAVNTPAPPYSPPPAARPPSAAKPKRAKARPVGEEDDDGPGALTTFARGDNMRPVFAGGEFDRDDGIGFLGRALVGIGAFLLVVGVGGGYLFLHLKFGQDQGTVTERRVTNENPRQAALSKAQSEMLLQPESSLEIMRKLVIDKPDDPVGKEALQSLLEYYRQQQRPIDAGKILMDIHRPLEAVKLFLSESSLAGQTEAEKALFAAYEASADPAQKKDLLLQDIGLLLGPVDRKDLAVERLKLFVKAFPGAPHPYGFYLKNTDEKIYDLFNRISFYFVQSLLAFSLSEFPEISLNGRPVVEVLRERPDQYRIVGKYKGKVTLNLDNLDDIYFTYWMASGQWYVVDTNLTTERKRWAANNRQRLLGKMLGANELMAYLEGIFKSQFPDAALHEKVDPGQAAKHKRHDE
jgi:hypothetical protein